MSPVRFGVFDCEATSHTTWPAQLLQPKMFPTTSNEIRFSLISTNADFSFTYHPEQRKRFRDGSLVGEWRMRYHDLFDEKDEVLARNQPQKHFYEWLSAVLLREAIGYEGYIAKTHARKRKLFASIVPEEVFSFVDANQSGIPDLFVYSPTGDCFFCEVKGGPDKVRLNQELAFGKLHEVCKKRVRILHLAEFHRQIISYSSRRGPGASHHITSTQKYHYVETEFA